MTDCCHYYPFGMLMPKRSTAGAFGYRYGFNGKENDNEVKALGNQQDYGMRIYDNRLGRFLSVDPINKQYPELTPYQFASNRPIDGTDKDGLEWELSTPNVNLQRRIPFLVPQTKGNVAPVKNQTAGLNLGFLKLDKQSYENTSWWIPSTKAGTFVNNSIISGYNQAVEGVETSSLLFSKNGRQELRDKTITGLVRLCYWLGETSDEEKLEFVQEKLTDVNTYEDLAGAFLLSRASNGFLKPGGSIPKGVYLTKIESLQLFFLKLEEAAAASNVDDAIKIINNTLDAVEDA